MSKGPEPFKVSLFKLVLAGLVLIGGAIGATVDWVRVITSDTLPENWARIFLWLWLCDRANEFFRNTLDGYKKWISDLKFEGMVLETQILLEAIKRSRRVIRLGHDPSCSGIGSMYNLNVPEEELDEHPEVIKYCTCDFPIRLLTIRSLDRVLETRGGKEDAPTDTD